MYKGRRLVPVAVIVFVTMVFVTIVHDATLHQLGPVTSSTTAAVAERNVDLYQNHHEAVNAILPANRRRCMVVHLHFHKAGGTTILSHFKKLKLIRGREGPILGRPTKNFLMHAGDPEFWKNLKLQGNEFVSLESDFLTPDQMKNISHSCIHFVTIVRDPWSRFRSTYERELFLKYIGLRRGLCVAKNSLDKWMKEENTNHQYPRENAWGGTLSPNYYIRMLNGINSDTNHQELTDFHLEQAKSIMRRFDVVALLEDATDMKNKIDTFFGATSDDLPVISNNQLKKWPSYQAIVAKANKQRGLFEEQNLLDRQFYNWVKEELINGGTRE